MKFYKFVENIPKYVTNENDKSPSRGATKGLKEDWKNINKHIFNNQLDETKLNFLEYIYSSTEGPYQSPDRIEVCILNKLASMVDTNKVIVEFGSWRGRSTCFIAEALNKKNRPLFLTIDHFKGDSTGGEGADITKFKNNLQKFGFYNRVNLIKEDMLQVNFDKILNGKKIELIFYDADHNTRPTIQCVKRVNDYLTKDALICFHDAFWDMTQKAIRTICNNLGFKVVNKIDIWEGFIIIQKE